MRTKHNGECPTDGLSYHGYCVGLCPECDEHLLTTGRYAVYCPSCDTCPECGCPQVDGFLHNAGCPDVDVKEAE